MLRTSQHTSLFSVVLLTYIGKNTLVTKQNPRSQKNSADLRPWTDTSSSHISETHPQVYANQWLLPPQIWNRNQMQLPLPIFAQVPPIFGLNFLPLLNSSFPPPNGPPLGLLLLYNGGSFVKGVDCSNKK